MTMTVSALLMLILLFFRVIKKYGWVAVLHPGLWFALAWITALFSYWAIDAVGGVPVHNGKVFEQLMVMVLVTAVSFYLLTLFELPRASGGQFHGAAPFPLMLVSTYKLFAGIGLLGALVNWMALGANFGYDDQIRQQWLSRIPPITAAMWYLYLLSFPAAIIAGRFFVSEILQGMSLFRWKAFYWLTPIVAGFFWSLGTGGRQALGILLFHFVIGAAFSLGWAARAGYRISLRSAIRLFSPAFLIVLLFALFVGLTGLSRAKQQGADASSFDGIWYLAPVGQLFSYNGLTLATHQAYGEPVLRDLSETGPVSFAGFQYFGLRFITGWRPLSVDDTNPERALASQGLELASGTRNVFYDLQADFGFEGAIGASLILAVISHLLFTKTRFLGTRQLLRVSPLAMAIMFWGYSHQFSLLMFNTFFWLVVSCVLWDMAGVVFKYLRISTDQYGR